MTEFFLQIVNMSLSATWLVLAVITARFLLKKAPKWVNVLLWGLVAFRLVCPFTLESAMSLIPSAEVISPEIMTDAAPTITTGIPAVNSVVNPVISETFAPEPTASANPLQIWIPVASVVWCIGMAVMLLYTMVSYGRLRYRVRMAIRAKDNIYLSEYVSSPFVLGIFQPRIYLPYHMDDLDRFHVIAHERTHIRRRDHWWKPLGFLLLTVHWFNPAMWLSYILLCRDIELACDERVIKELGTSQRADYSQALLHCSVTHRSIAACPIAFGEVGVKQRVKNVLSYKKPAFWVICVCLIVVLIVSVCFLTDPETENAGDLPVTMTLEFVSRTRAHLIFQYSEELPDDEVHIPEAYTLEQLVDGNWEELPRLREERDFAIVAEIDNADFDAWSLPNWSEDYGTLSDGTYRIKKEVAYAAESHSIYAEFTIGGTAEDYITLKLEDITPTGVTLYEQETVEDTFDLIYDAGYWLETLQEGQWTYLEPTGYVEPIFENEKRYIYCVYHSSGAIELDWSHLYGELPSGTYRIVREVTYVGDPSPRVLTSHAEFTVGSDWGIDLFIDRLSENGITVSLLLDDSLQEGEYFFAGSTLQCKDRISWTDVRPMTDLPDGPDIVTELPSFSLLWSEDRYRMTEGDHRIGVRIKHVLPDGTEEFTTLYEYFDPSTYAWGVSTAVSELTQENGEWVVTLQHSSSQNIPDGTVTMSHTFGLEKRENNQWIDMGQPRQEVPDTQHPVSGIAYYETERIVLNPYFGELQGRTYRLVKYVTRRHSDGTTETRPVYAIFAIDPPIPLPDKLSSCEIHDNGEDTLTVTDSTQLENLHTLFANAETEDSGPAPEDMTLGLTLVGSGGSTVEILLDWNSDTCYIGGKYFDYGPGENEDAREYLFEELLGITYSESLARIQEAITSDPEHEANRLRRALGLAEAHQETIDN